MKTNARLLTDQQKVARVRQSARSLPGNSVTVSRTGAALKRFLALISPER
ncbi:hypothetical protein BN435_2125 [Erwinia amylovora 01SFR-BO]|uniref:Uncharacterized protein n=2 Tax=Erwinia amylovora TaxID=552 RepID=A0A831A371_ERWAM|nr:hypothetical protein predicted by Glimmer/Critica [Erwinia amylovora ATCC BAA-2158]CCO78928.1 hypothetical protein BN432_2133 [Erwinia amylovora Ea356]CCO82726.1 hypothetical protein BN433_2158 [Erwinia amylovora Ea266]CCO90293.1 hypothetical protein BN435_2125 [Erwinia amylovora 01SFR-BO]CCO94059.1 hypothetical protein BN437_2132 [Erwinia amylovora NBRC 12687 = CFBP 1232]CCO99405.1 hypothetical protein BN438_2125 [Erwinia amylovora UPN527]